MKSIVQRSLMMVALLAFAVTSSAMAAPKGERAKKITIEGEVLKVDAENRTLIVIDRSSEKLYLVNVPNRNRAAIKITFGRNMKLNYPELSDIEKGDQVRVRWKISANERLAELEDGSAAVTLTLTN